MNERNESQKAPYTTQLAGIRKNVPTVQYIVAQLRTKPPNTLKIRVFIGGFEQWRNTTSSTLNKIIGKHNVFCYVHEMSAIPPKTKELIKNH